MSVDPSRNRPTERLSEPHAFYTVTLYSDRSRAPPHVMSDGARARSRIAYKEMPPGGFCFKTRRVGKGAPPSLALFFYLLRHFSSLVVSLHLPELLFQPAARDALGPLDGEPHGSAQRELGQHPERPGHAEHDSVEVFLRDAIVLQEHAGVRVHVRPWVPDLTRLGQDPRNDLVQLAHELAQSVS